MLRQNLCLRKIALEKISEQGELPFNGLFILSQASLLPCEFPRFA
jgi:hypothetical protein